MNDCIEWTRARTADGYGQVWHEGKVWRAHRLAFLKAFGWLPPVVMHRCDNPPCVNPDHLQPGTVASNNQDAASKKRVKNGNIAKTHCPSGHPYNEQNTYIAKDGHRLCRVCDRERKRRKYAATKEGDR